MGQYINIGKELLPLLLLVAFFSALTFHNLGDREAPQTVWSEDRSVIIDFGEPVYISRFQFMLGQRNDVDFMLFASLDGNEWHFTKHVSDNPVFAWSELPMDTFAKYAQIVPFGPGLRLQEIAFRDSHDHLLVPFQTFSDWEIDRALFDEQHLVPTSRSFRNSTYFDEIYHARTAYEFLHGLPVFEVTHPPMGKNFIAMGISAFGMTPFGWRFAGTMAGILMIPLMYIFGRVVFRSPFWGMFTATIFAFDFMTFAQTRIATIDSYIVLFVIASYLCMFIYVRDAEDMPLKKSLLTLLGAGVFIGLAIASKWQGVYAAVGLPFVFFPTWYKVYKIEPKGAWITFASCFLFFLAIPISIYALSYIPFVNSMDRGYGFLSTVIANQEHMFTYHARLTEGHTFSSRWWEWPLITRPIFYYVNRVSPYISQGKSSFGNPAVWWTGIFATVAAARALFISENNTGQNGKIAGNNMSENQLIVLFLLIAYAAQYLPWVFVFRATFIYHYFPSVPFVVLLIAFCFKNFITPKFSKAPWIYGAVVMGLFFLFYPVLSGSPVFVDFVHRWLRWFPAWVLV